MESSNLVAAVFYLLSAHYIFNVQYHPKAKELLTFLRECCACPAASINEALRLCPTSVQSNHRGNNFTHNIAQIVAVVHTWAQDHSLLHEKKQLCLNLTEPNQSLHICRTSTRGRLVSLEGFLAENFRFLTCL